MDDAELLVLLADRESDRVERKASASDREEIKKAVCAFANDLPGHRKPGVVFIGVNDDGTPTVDFKITNKVETDVASIVRDGNILPLPDVAVGRRILNGTELLVITVEPADAPPVRLRGRVWIRVGPRRATASPQEERRLAEKRRAKDLPFELSPVSWSKLSDLDLDLFERVYLPAAVAPDVIAENQRSRVQQLQSLRFLSLDPEPLPTALGLLVIGREPHRFIGGAYVQFVRFPGTTMLPPVKDQSELHGSMPLLVPEINRVLRTNVAVSLEMTGGPADVKTPDYPIAALQQIVWNALMHRSYEGTNAPVHLYWYSDRVEIRSPGGLYGEVTPENLGEPNAVSYRNLYVAEAMKNLGVVQRFGFGIALARAELEKNGNPPLELKATPTHVFATIRRRP